MTENNKSGSFGITSEEKKYILADKENQIPGQMDIVDLETECTKT